MKYWVNTDCDAEGPFNTRKEAEEHLKSFGPSTCCTPRVVDQEEFDRIMGLKK